METLRGCFFEREWLRSRTHADQPRESSHQQRIAVHIQGYNEAEYEVLLAGLRLVEELQVDKLLIFSDSKLVVS